MTHQIGHLHASAERSATEDRRFERETIRKNAILYSHDRMQSVLIRDVSCGGMKIQNAFGLMPGDVSGKGQQRIFTIQVPTGAVGGQ